MLFGNLDAVDGEWMHGINTTDTNFADIGLCGEGSLDSAAPFLSDDYAIPMDADFHQGDFAHCFSAREDLEQLDLDLDLDLLPDLDTLLNEACLDEGSVSNIFHVSENSSALTAEGLSECNNTPSNSLSHGRPYNHKDRSCKSGCCSHEPPSHSSSHVSTTASMDSYVTPAQACPPNHTPGAPTGPSPLALQAIAAVPLHETSPEPQRCPSPESSGVSSTKLSGMPMQGLSHSPSPSTGSSSRVNRGGSTRAGHPQEKVSLGCKRPMAVKRLRSPEPRGVSSSGGGSSRDDNDSASPAESSDEGPVASGHSTAKDNRGPPARPAALAPVCAVPLPSRAEAPTNVAPQGFQAAAPLPSPACVDLPPQLLNPAAGLPGVPVAVPVSRGVPEQAAGAVGGHDGAQPQKVSEQDSEGPLTEEQRKKAERMQRNRESALLSRQRKKTMLDDLDRRNKELETQNAQLNGMVGHLQAENATLRTVLAQTCAKYGEPIPALPFPVAGVPGLPGIGMPYGFPPVMPYAVPMPGAVGSLKVPLQKLAVPARPAPAPKPPAKRSRKESVVDAVKGGKGAMVMLSLCCLFIFGCNVNLRGGVVTPVTQLSFSALPSQPFPLAALPASNSTPLALPAAGSHSDYQSGRVLAGLEIGGQAQHTTIGSAVSLVHAAWDDLQRHGEQNGSHGILQNHDLLSLHPNDPEVEKEALKYLKEMGVVAVMDGSGKQAASPPAPGHSVQTMTASFFNSRGLLPPVTCKQVFRVDEEDLSDQIAARQKLQQYLPSLQLRGGALPLPPIGGLSKEYGQEVANGSRGRNETIGSAKDDGELLVSIVLPAKQSTLGEDAQLTSLDQLFVVVTKPGRMYSTHMCTLQKPVLI
eukprot:jgi/Botrbrau1/22524/Bobra.114_2s0049.2